METGKPDLRWGVERRLEFIEFRLFWEGHVNRGDLMTMFGISMNQATKDLNQYASMAPGNFAYHKSVRAFVRGDSFRAVFLKPDAARYLSQLRSLADGILDTSEAWLAKPPEFYAAPTPARGVDAVTLRTILSAIRRREALEVDYQSLSRPDPVWRWIAPHAIGFDGFRWHTRAYCFIDNRFKDFVLSRIFETRGTKPTEIDPELDEDWHEQVVLEIGPHPDLTDNQKAVIALDYGMVDGKAEITVRKAFLYYTLKRLGLDTDPSARKPQDQQIVLIDRRDTVTAFEQS